MIFKRYKELFRSLSYEDALDLFFLLGCFIQFFRINFLNKIFCGVLKFDVNFIIEDLFVLSDALLLVGMFFFFFFFLFFWWGFLF